jgi:hypothetical protein
VLRVNAALANQINPDQAGGVFLDALWKLTGGQRLAADASVVRNVALTGQPGTLVPPAASRSHGSGRSVRLRRLVTLGAGGTAAVDFVAQ